MARITLGTPIATQLARLDKERERLVQLDEREVVFEIPDNLDKIPVAERIVEIDAIVSKMGMTMVRSFLDFCLEAIAAAREGGFPVREGQGLPAWIRDRNRQEPATTSLLCSQCNQVQEAVDAAKNHDKHPEGHSFGKCVKCGNQNFKILGTA